MKPIVSLRTRVMLGAALWTVGLFLLVTVVFTALTLHYPRLPLVFHGMALRYHVALLAVVALALVAGLLQVKRGLASLDQLRTRLTAVRSAEGRIIEGDFPAEVRPLVDDLNALLQHRESAVKRAIAKAGDLAHGLKTPLAVLTHDAERARAHGQHDLAASLNEQIARMRRQVDYHLAHARAAASGAAPGARCIVADRATALARTLARLHAERGLHIDVQIPADLIVRAEREDVDEMLGNLLDNACKWAASQVRLSVEAGTGANAVLSVDDDGPGLDAGLRETVLQRGVRADEAAPGAGLGLAIVRDLAELYGGSIVLATSPLGGLRARLELPRC